MSGMSSGACLAEQFRFIANEANSEKWHVDFDDLYNRAIADIERMAKAGGYEYRLLNSKLRDQRLLSQLTRVFRGQKFNVETGSTSEHYILISWK